MANGNRKNSHKLRSLKYVKRLAENGLQWSTWYDRAIGEIDDICRLENWDKQHFTSVLAILSPRVSVRRNCRSALLYCGQEQAFFANTLPNVKTSLATYLRSGIVGGNKVPYFRNALLGDSESVTLDTWMAYALLAVESPHIKYFTRKNTFYAARKLVCKVGQAFDLSPRDSQAAIWCGMFLESGQLPQFFPLWAEYQNWIAHKKRFPLVGTIGDHSEPVDEFRVDELLTVDDTSFDVESFANEF